MLKKRRKNHKSGKYTKQQNKRNLTAAHPATGLRSDEIGVVLDLGDSAKTKSYIHPTGISLKPTEKGAPLGIPSIIDPSLILTFSKQQGIRPTLASRLGEMLTVAEDLFGQRDRSFAFLGFEFTEDAQHVHFQPNKSMIMRLPANAMLDPMIVYAYMAHESVHMLSPYPHKPVTILEEGMAEVFAYLYMRDTMKFIIPSKRQDSAYREAGELVASLIDIDAYGIKRIREEQPTISLISEALLRKHYPTLGEGAAKRLVRTFVSDSRTDPDVLAWYERESSEAS